MKPEAPHLVTYRRLARRSLGSLLLYKFLHDYGYDKGEVVARAIVDDICATVASYGRRRGELQPGQLVYNAPAASERAGHGKTMAKTRMIPVVLSLVADEDVEAFRAHLSSATRRARRLRRLADEAHAQGALLSEADLGLLLGVSQSSVSNAVRGARRDGEWLPIRGYLADMGRFPTHKAAIVGLYLSGLTTPDIAARTHHSKESVDRYIRAFDQLRLLATRFDKDELPLLTGLSLSVIEQYLELLTQHGYASTPTGATPDRVPS